MEHTVTLTEDREALECIITENIALKQKMENFSTMPFHRMAAGFNTLSFKESLILFQTGILSERIFIPKQSAFDLDKYQVHFANGSVQFLQRLLEKNLVDQDVKLLVRTNTNKFALKPIMYEHRQTLDYMLLRKLANPDVTDSEGCPIFLDSWRLVDSEALNLFKIHKLLTLGAKGLGTNTNGDNILHFIASAKLPWDALKSVMRYFVKREHLQTLVSQRNSDGLTPLHMLVRHIFKQKHREEYSMIGREIFEFMLELGADINAPIYPSGLTVLHLIILNYNFQGDIVPGEWAYLMTRHFQILPDASGVTPLALAMYYRRKHLLEFILDNVDLNVRDVLSRHSVIIPYLDQLIPFYEKHHRKALLLRIKHGLRPDSCREVDCLPENIVPFQNKNLVDDGLVLTLDNIKVYSTLKSPWFLDYLPVQIEALLIRTVNQTLHPSTLHYVLNSYLDSLNSNFQLPTDSVTEHNYMSDFNFQLSKHLCRIARALGHLRFKYSLSFFIDKFFQFLDCQLLPLLSRKLYPKDINAVRNGYIDHFIQDVAYQINIVLYMWYGQLSVEEKTGAKNSIRAVWNRIESGPNSKLTVFGMFVAAVSHLRVKIGVEIKLNPIDILELFKDMGVNLNTRMSPSLYTPLSWIISVDKRRNPLTLELLLKLCEIGVYVYARDQGKRNVIDLSLRHSHTPYKKWATSLFMVPKPLSTLCSECIIDNGIPFKSIGRCRNVVDFIKLHGCPSNELDLRDESRFRPRVCS